MMEERDVSLQEVWAAIGSYPEGAKVDVWNFISRHHIGKVALPEPEPRYKKIIDIFRRKRMLGKPPKDRKLGDWIDSFLEFTDPIPSPRIFRLWAGITALSGATERRLWTTTADRILYPNLYTLLVAPPAVGKTEAINPVEDIWHHVKNLKIAPKSVTRASLVDSLVDAQKRVPISQSDIIEYASLCVGAGELGVLLPAHDLDFLSVLNHLYDNPPQHSEKRRALKIDHHIINPQLTILAGTQPQYLSSLLPEEAWGMGFMSRQLMVYSGTPVKVELFPEFFSSSGAPSIRKALRNSLIEDMRVITEMYGAMEWERETAMELRQWHSQGMQPAPEHSKLIHYSGRRIIHVVKLSMIASLSRGNDRKITPADLTRAREWLLEAESTMPDIFREMVGRNDAQTIADLHFFIYALWMKNGNKPIHNTMIWHFLSTKVPSERIRHIVDLAERTNVIQRIAGTSGENSLFVPRPKTSHGME